MTATEKLNAKPFVKWAGGKRNLIPSLMPCLPRTFNDYFEPFVGGGALFFHLYNQNMLDSKKIFLNDKNSELINAYKQIQLNPQKLLNQLEILQNSHSKQTFYSIRDADRSPDFQSLDKVLRAARFIYLNKSCFNGLCRYNSKGFFNTPIGSYENPKIYDNETILNDHVALNNTNITNKDFSDVLSKAKKDDFVYFDPPYFPLNKTSSFVTYSDVFLENEQIRLFEVFEKLNSIGVKVLQSNSNTDFIKELYKNYEIIEINANRSINCKGDKRGKISELVIKGDYTL